MEKHCVSLEIAKQLKEAGFKKETEFWWVMPNFLDTNKEFRIALKDNAVYQALNFGGLLKEQIIAFYPAPLATEILEELPVGYYATRLLDKDDKFYKCINSDFTKDFNGDNLADALAKMWLYLKKEKIIQ